MPDASVGFSVYSPPFGSLFVYSDSECDMGNSSSDGEFGRHYEFMVQEKFRATKPGRLTAVHCSDLPMTKWKDGEIGIVGYEIPFNRHFYQYQPPRPLEEIDADLDAVSKEIMDLLREVHS